MEGALRLLQYVEARRPTGRRLGADADARWSSFRGDLETVDRIELTIRDADAEWPGGFGARGDRLSRRRSGRPRARGGAGRRLAESFAGWTQLLATQVAAAWILSCVFVRTLEDRGLLKQARRRRT